MIKIKYKGKYRDFLTPAEFAKKVGTTPQNLRQQRYIDKKFNKKQKYEYIRVNGCYFYLTN